MMNDKTQSYLDQQIAELDDAEVNCISGGLPFLGAAAIGIAGLALFNGSFSAGKELGKFVYHVMHTE
ncbi:hypothetical protein F2P45_33925 [Massilia sp. CCM 8733]|uniref:Class IIb bacteriocin, lactobin A/cerein 7B family n=1 Tax=Massilia mucilaginosa TaxID=2609282 RepID=A0ABX0P5G2_9BURK|nr:hypothetical protein [Massilia mucilaginosa]NHZ93956.1 hypothetical protein [Massilia mucilaginosa]